MSRQSTTFHAYLAGIPMAESNLMIVMIFQITIGRGIRRVENKSGRNVLAVLGYVFIPFIMVFSVWKRRRWTNPLRIAFTVWAVFMAVVVIETATSNNNQSTKLSPPIEPTSTNAPKINASNTTANTTKTTVSVKPAANQDDVAFLKAVNGIMYNTFVEATNIGDQMTQVGKSQESMGAFSDFIDSDRVLWDEYLAQVRATKPQDPFLQMTQQQIVDDLTKLQHGAQTMTDAATKNDVDTIIGASHDMLVAFNEIKQGYSQAVSQMSNDGIQPTWTPNN